MQFPSSLWSRAALAFAHREIVDFWRLAAAVHLTRISESNLRDETSVGSSCVSGFCGGCAGGNCGGCSGFGCGCTGSANCGGLGNGCHGFGCDHSFHHCHGEDCEVEVVKEKVEEVDWRTFFDGPLQDLKTSAFVQSDGKECLVSLPVSESTSSGRLRNVVGEHRGTTWVIKGTLNGKTNASIHLKVPDGCGNVTRVDVARGQATLRFKGNKAFSSREVESWQTKFRSI